MADTDLPDDSPALPEQTNALVLRPASLPVAATAEPMGRSEPGPDWSSFPSLMSPQQIAAACSITDAQARTNGGRGYYGKVHTHMKGRKKLTFYERANVERYYRSVTEPQTHTEEDAETGAQMGKGPASVLFALEKIAKNRETERAQAGTIETNATTIERLVRQNEKLTDRVGELERLLREQSEQYVAIGFGLYRKKR